MNFGCANNPLWVIRKDSSEIEEYKGDKQPIGKFAYSDNFKTQKIQLNPGDSFYLFSNGYADQFGGEKGKKFKGVNFKKLLLSAQGKTLEEQMKIIDTTFEEWRSSIEQLDDVCVIGVRV
ncbi:MAG: serine/threonine-protein phosphatase [Crocinitomicaceae bacterium]|nr:serine/threonine-protein phosphatase [Crocinitomicaceae bacterium]